MPTWLLDFEPSFGHLNSNHVCHILQLRMPGCRKSKDSDNNGRKTCTKFGCKINPKIIFLDVQFFIFNKGKST